MATLQKLQLLTVVVRSPKVCFYVSNHCKHCYRGSMEKRKHQVIKRTKQTELAEYDKAVVKLPRISVSHKQLKGKLKFHC